MYNWLKDSVTDIGTGVGCFWTVKVGKTNQKFVRYCVCNSCCSCVY